MFGLGQLKLIALDAILCVSDGMQSHPICMKAWRIYGGEEFKIHLEPNAITGSAYENHKYDNCCIQVKGEEVPLEKVCIFLGLPLPNIVDGRFDCKELQQAIAKKHLQLQEIEVVNTPQEE